MKSSCYTATQGIRKPPHPIPLPWGERGRVRVWIFIIALIMGLLAVPELSLAISPQQLQEMLARGDEVTVIDIRGQDLYTEGHISGAINIPSAIIARKGLPSIGIVVVYGDGIRTDLTIEAVNALNSRTGIKADMLEGGFSAWEALNLPTTHKSGFREERLTYLSYQELENVAAANPDVVLVDLRTTPEQGKGKTALAARPERQATQTPEVVNSTLTDLSAKFPGLNTIRLPRKLQSEGKEWDISTVTRRVGKDTHYRWFYILIDDGDGEAEKIAHSLKAAGIKRVAILTGGEQILRRGGSPGLETIKTREK